MLCGKCNTIVGPNIDLFHLLLLVSRLDIMLPFIRIFHYTLNKHEDYKKNIKSLRAAFSFFYLWNAHIFLQFISRAFYDLKKMTIKNDALENEVRRYATE